MKKYTKTLLVSGVGVVFVIILILVFLDGNKNKNEYTSDSLFQKPHTLHFVRSVDSFNEKYDPNILQPKWENIWEIDVTFNSIHDSVQPVDMIYQIKNSEGKIKEKLEFSLQYNINTLAVKKKSGYDYTQLPIQFDPYDQNEQLKPPVILSSTYFDHQSWSLLLESLKNNSITQRIDVNEKISLPDNYNIIQGNNIKFQGDRTLKYLNDHSFEVSLDAFGDINLQFNANGKKVQLTGKAYKKSLLSGNK